MRVVFLIPARGGSKRLKRKNLYPINGIPSIEYAINACKGSKYFDENLNIYVSSEDEEILEFCKSQPVQTIKRPKKLSEDNVWTQEVLKHAVEYLEEECNLNSIDLVVRVQANSPQVTSAKIDECVNKLIKYRLWEVFTVDEDGVEDAAVHVLKRDCVFQKALSVYKGIVVTNYIDIHTIEDVTKVERKLKL